MRRAKPAPGGVAAINAFVCTQFAKPTRPMVKYRSADFPADQRGREWDISFCRAFSQHRFCNQFVRPIAGVAFRRHAVSRRADEKHANTRYLRGIHT